MVKNQKGRRMKVLRSDNGDKYASMKFKAYLARKGIKHSKYSRKIRTE